METKRDRPVSAGRQFREIEETGYDFIVPRPKPDKKPDLLLVLDSIDATEEDWRQLAAPGPAVLETARRVLLKSLGFPIGASEQ